MDHDHNKTNQDSTGPNESENHIESNENVQRLNEYDLFGERMKQYEYLLPKTKQTGFDLINDHEQGSLEIKESIFVAHPETIKKSNIIQNVVDEYNYLEFQNIDCIINEMLEEENMNGRLLDFLKVF